MNKRFLTQVALSSDPVPDVASGRFSVQAASSLDVFDIDWAANPPAQVPPALSSSFFPPAFSSSAFLLSILELSDTQVYAP